MQPSSAEYWHIGDTTMRLGSVTLPRRIGVNSSGCGNRDLPFEECLPDLAGEGHRAGLVAVQAQGFGGYRHAPAGEARTVALLHHRQRLLHGLPRVLDHAPGPVARREAAVVGVATVREHFAGDRDAHAFRFFIVFTF